MDYHLFLEKASIKEEMVEVRTKQGGIFQGYPLYFDEADDNCLGYIFESIDGSLTGIFFQDIESVKIMQRSQQSVS